MFPAAVKFKLTKAPQLTSFASSVTAAADDLGAISTTNDTNSKQLNITIVNGNANYSGHFHNIRHS